MLDTSNIIKGGLDAMRQPDLNDILIMLLGILMVGLIWLCKAGLLII
jgi:hypothetical protein